MEDGKLDRGPSLYLQIKFCICLFALLACKIGPDKEKELNPLTLTHPNNLVTRDQRISGGFVLHRYNICLD